MESHKKHTSDHGLSVPVRVRPGTTATKSRMRELSPAWMRLLRWMQGTGFGRFESLVVKGGEPAFEPPPRVLRHIKLTGENALRPEIRLEDFSLPTEVLEMIRQLSDLRYGVVQSIEIKHGLPFSILIDESTAVWFSGSDGSSP